MARKLLVIALLFGFGVTISAPVSAAKVIPCGCAECEVYGGECVSDTQVWSCAEYWVAYNCCWQPFPGSGSCNTSFSLEQSLATPAVSLCTSAAPAPGLGD